MTEEIALLTKLEKDNEWFSQNFEELQETYEEKFIAIENGKVLESASNFQKLFELLKNKKINPALILIKFIHERGTSVII